jgi:aldehyde:ferredoxin oxidoreductase
MKEGTGEFKYPAGVHKPEYETLGMFGTNLLCDNLDAIILANDYCNRYGTDTISTGSAVAFAIECYERGLITKKDTDGLEMTWGNAKSIVEMTRKICLREGFGNILADGSLQAAKKIGKGSEQFAMQVQGQDYAAHDPRKGYQFAVAYKMDATPGRHTRDSGMPQPGVKKPDIDPTSFAGRAVHQKIGMSFFYVIDASGCCHFVSGTLPPGEVSGNGVVDFINAVTGWTYSVDDYLKIGERIGLIRYAFTIREGLNPLKFKTPIECSASLR